VIGEIDIRRLQRGDADCFGQLTELFSRVFDERQERVDARQLNKLLSKSSFYALVVHQNDRLVGGLTAYEIESYQKERSELFVYDIAILEEYRQRGIGRKLMGYLVNERLDTRIDSLFVTVHAKDPEALEFYRTVMGAGEATFNFSIKLADWNQS